MTHRCFRPKQNFTSTLEEEVSRQTDRVDQLEKGVTQFSTLQVPKQNDTPTVLTTRPNRITRTPSHYKPGWTQVSASKAIEMAKDEFLKYWNPTAKVLKNPSTNREATGLSPFQDVNSKPYYVMLKGTITRTSIQNQWKRMTHSEFSIPISYTFRSSDSSTNTEQIYLKIAWPNIADHQKSLYNCHLYCFNRSSESGLEIDFSMVVPLHFA